MKAVLKTRCGCTRMIDVDGSPEVVRVPLADPYGLFFQTEKEALMAQATSRRFRLTTKGWIAVGGGPIETLVYIEDEA